MLDRYDKNVYGVPEWAGRRAKAWTAAVSVLYALLAAALIVWGVNGRWMRLFPACAAVLFFLWRIHRLHEPVVLVCRDALLVLAPGAGGEGWRGWLRPVYYVIDYDDVAGFSPRWQEIYVGTETEGGLARVPASLSHLTPAARETLCRRIEEKQRRWMIPEVERKDRHD